MAVRAVFELGLAVLLFASSCGASPAGAPVPGTPMTGDVRIVFLHHSTGGVVWSGGVQSFIQGWNAAHGTRYQITEQSYPATTGGYPWANYPYDYWNLWVSFTGTRRDRGEQNLDDLAAANDVIVFKHCFSVSAIGPDTGAPSVASSLKTVENYKAQYLTLRGRMRQFPGKRFVVWTGAALTEASTDAAQAQRARDFFAWVKSTWDEPGDNVFVWDFRECETGGGLYLQAAYASSPTDSHPNAALASLAAPLMGKRLVDVIEGRGDSGSLTGQ